MSIYTHPELASPTELCEISSSTRVTREAGGLSSNSPFFDADRRKAAILSVRWLRSLETCRITSFQSFRVHSKIEVTNGMKG
ncbi:hypothetical protein V6N13_138204 [Hibiscus sabdariffa]